MKGACTTAEASSEGMTRTRRSRTFHYPGRVLLVVSLLFISFVGFAIFLLTGLAMLWNGDRQLGLYAVGSLAVMALARLLVFVLARSLNCSLCYGPVMHEKACRKHRDALRLPLLSHRTSAAVSAACTGSFRCMYCGTPYRLWK